MKYILLTSLFAFAKTNALTFDCNSGSYSKTIEFSAPEFKNSRAVYEMLNKSMRLLYESNFVSSKFRDALIAKSDLYTLLKALASKCKVTFKMSEAESYNLPEALKNILGELQKEGIISIQNEGRSLYLAEIKYSRVLLDTTKEYSTIAVAYTWELVKTGACSLGTSLGTIIAENAAHYGPMAGKFVLEKGKAGTIAASDMAIKKAKEYSTKIGAAGSTFAQQGINIGFDGLKLASKETINAMILCGHIAQRSAQSPLSKAYSKVRAFLGYKSFVARV